MPNDEVKLLPCPFCGGPGKMIHPMGNWTKDGYGPNGSRITCASPGCTGLGQACYGPTQDADAIEAWNRRAIPSTVSGETEALAMARAVIADMVENGLIHSSNHVGGYYVGENVVPIIMGRASPTNPAETQAVEVGFLGRRWDEETKTYREEQP